MLPMSKKLGLLLAVATLCGCSHIQFGREFDEQGNEVEPAGSQPASSQSARSENQQSTNASAKSEVDKFADDYYGEDHREFVEAFEGELKIARVTVSNRVPTPYANTRQQRMPGVWGSREPTEESKAVEEQVLAYFANATDPLSQQLPKYIRRAFDEQLTIESSDELGQVLVVTIHGLGLSDQIGLYSANLRAEVSLLAVLRAHDGTVLWSGQFQVDANEDDRPMAGHSEFESDQGLILKHFRIAAQFAVHKILTSIMARPYSHPEGYDASQWIDLED
jgi:hypothetical protein